jgi:predicted  nucleic acid-binding Zn-ribbon protein
MQDPKDNLDKKTLRRRLQVDLTMLESDHMKNERKLEELRAEQVRLKRKKEQLEMEIAEGDLEVKKIEGDQAMIFGEIRKLRKKINAL